MSKLLDDLNKYKEGCLDDGGYVIEGEAERLLFQSAKAIERYENIIHTVANIDTIFYQPDGEDRDWNNEEALEAIYKLVTPIWTEHCEESRVESTKRATIRGSKLKLG